MSTAADMVDGEEEENRETAGDDRLWLIQCKRERTITPRKLRGYLDAIPAVERSQLYGIIFAAACDFSKAARDVMRLWCSENSIAEYQLWGKADLEDLLFQPKNDNLLFAYFGISLQIRKRSLKTELRTQTTTKRKLKRLIEKSNRTRPAVLIRDPTDERYPALGDANWKKRPDERDNRWRICDLYQITHAGLACEAASFHGFLDDDGKRWDCANVYNSAAPNEYVDPWNGGDDDSEIESAVLAEYLGFPDENRIMVHHDGLIPFDSILEVDEIGDDVSDLPHLLIDWPQNKLLPFAKHRLRFWRTPRQSQGLSLENRIEKFPVAMRRRFPWQK